MGESVVVVLLGGVVLLAVVFQGFKVLNRKLSPVTEIWEGDVVAAIVTYAPTPGLRGDGSPQSADVIIRRRGDRTEHSCFVGGTESLPFSVRQQVFDSGLLTPLSPNLSREAQQQALDAPKSGAYRYNLPDPVPVHVEVNERGELHWTALR